MKPTSSTNLKNRVSKLYLPKTKPLLPLFEVISNAIHAIDEKTQQLDGKFVGKIEIKITRTGDVNTLESLEDIDIYPINSFIVVDNGIGFDQDNITSFAEFDTERKARIGGKGVGRLVCLKAFQKIIVQSIYQDKGEFHLLKFEYKKTKEGFDKYEDGLPAPKKKTGTFVELHKIEDEFSKHLSSNIYEVAREIIAHFQLYFIQGIAPQIVLRNQNNIEVNLQRLYESEFAKEIASDSFEIGSFTFRTFVSKSYKAKSHKIHYCANERTVKEEGLSKYLEDLRYPVNGTDGGPSFFYQVFVVGDYLDKNVNEERTNFVFKQDDDDDELALDVDISLAKIRRETLNSIEKILEVYLASARKEKLESYFPIIESEYPNYLSVVNHKRDQVEKLPVGLTKEELDLKLYQIESNWRIDNKKQGKELLDRKKDITSLDEYKSLYQDFLAEFNEIGQSDLARYMVHRRSVIDLLDQLIELNKNEKFSNEDIIHSLFFPIRETKHSVPHEKQNLWLLDERLTFNSLLASDKRFNQIQEIASSSNDRMDLIIRKEDVFEGASLYSEEKIPYESFTILEFKKPERDDYKHGDERKDPVKQVRTYIEEIVENKIKVRGKSLGASIRTPFYCYIVADISDSLKKILTYEVFDETPDGLGFFKFYSTNTYKAYIEVVPFKKVIKDAKQRNKVLFDHLKLS